MQALFLDCAARKPQLERAPLEGGNISMRDHGLKSYDEIVAHYLAEKKSKADNELRWFRIQRKIHDAVRLAGLAKGPHGKRFRHQFRIPEQVLQRASRALLRNLHRLGRCKSFEALFRAVDETVSPIPGIGPLTVYDTALRIGARLGLSPEQVYLHAGTRHGAVALGLDLDRSAIPISELPKPLDQLSGGEAEDILCIYAGDLARLAKAAV
jgi:hypothetical protein